MLNSIESMDTHGYLGIQTVDALFINQKGEQKKGVQILISDTGCGIPEDVRPKMFDAFYLNQHQ